MPRTIATENPGVEVRRYLRQWANVERLDEQILVRHPGTSAEKRRRKARDISASVAQGIELLETASAASHLTKPLPLFYAAEALAKAVCVLGDPGLEGGDFKAHGLSGIKEPRYFVRTLSCRVNNPGADVWSRLVGFVRADLVALSQTIDGVGQITDIRGWTPTDAPRSGTELSIGELLRYLPDLAEDLPSGRWAHPHVVHARDLGIRITTGAPGGPPSNATVEITLRHAHNQDTRAMILRHFEGRGGLRHFTPRQDVFDVIGCFANGQTIGEIGIPGFRSDIFGELFMDLTRAKSTLSELAIYYAALFILSDAVRYQGQWGRLLEDHPDEAVLIDRFLDIAARKLPNLALNELAESVHLFKVGR